MEQTAAGQPGHALLAVSRPLHQHCGQLGGQQQLGLLLSLVPRQPFLGEGGDQTQGLPQTLALGPGLVRSCSEPRLEARK